MHHYEFHLHILPEEFVRYYRGAARHVIAETPTGQTVQFPASLLQKFVSQDGIRGNFILTCDDHHKVVELKRVAG